MQPQKRRPTLTAPAPSMYLDERTAESSARLADDYGNRFLNHWFVEAQAETALPELKALAQILRCNGEDWGKEDLASNCIKTALGLSKQMEHVWPGLYQLAALIKERGYYTQDIESWEQKTTLRGKATFEEWFCTYIHPSFEAFARMEAEYKLAEQTGAPLPRILDLDDLTPDQQVKVAQATQTYSAAAALIPAPGQGARTDLQPTDNIRKSDSDGAPAVPQDSGSGRRSDNAYGTSGADTYRRIQKLARGGDAHAATLLDQIDRGETTPHAAYIALGLRRPQISVQLEPGLHDQLTSYAERTGDKIREVVSDALEMFFRRMSTLEDTSGQTPAPEPAPEAALATNGFGGLLGDVLQAGFKFQGMSEEEESEAPAEQPDADEQPQEDEEDTDELNDTPLVRGKRSCYRKELPPAPEIEHDAPVTGDTAALVARCSRATLTNRAKEAGARGDAEVWVPSPDPRYAGIRKDLRLNRSSWRVFRRSADLPDDQPRRYPTERHEIDRCL